MKHYPPAPGWRAASQLMLEKRYGIYSLLKTDHTQSKIAKVLGVHKSSAGRLNETSANGTIDLNKLIIKQ